MELQQHALVDAVPAHGSGGGTRWSLRSLLPQTILGLCDLCKGWEVRILVSKDRGEAAELR